MTEAQIGGVACLVVGVAFIVWHRRLGDGWSAAMDSYGDKPFIREFEERHGTQEYRRFNRLFALGVGVTALVIGVYAVTL